MSKNKEILMDIMHLAGAALVMQDASMARIALGDIAEDLAKAGIDFPSPPPPVNLPGGFDAVSPSREHSVSVIKTPSTVVMQYRFPNGRTLSAELENETDGHYAQAFLYDGAENVCKVTFFGQYQRRSWTYPIMRRALNGLMSKAGHKARWNKNRKAK